MTATTYNVMILLSMISGIIVWAIILCKRTKDKLHIFTYVLTNTILVLFCGLSLTLFSSGFKGIGLSSLGGVIGIIISYIVFVHMLPDYKKEFQAAVTLSLPLMYGIGKIGCASCGCCYGRPYHGFGAIEGREGMVFPIQIVEAIIFLLVFVIVVYLYKRKSLNTEYAFIVYSILKFGLEFFRFDHQGKIITFNQVLCILIVAIVVIKYIYNNCYEVVEDNN